MSTQVHASVDAEDNFGKPATGWRRSLHTIVFESDTPLGKLFDVVLIATIVLSVVVVMLDSVEGVLRAHGGTLRLAEFVFTGLFTLEYLARLLCVRHPGRYATSFYGVIDLLSVLPTYVAVLVPEAGALIDVRVLRLLRIFRVFRLTEYMVEFHALRLALVASRRKILIFLSFVLMVVLVMATLMYVVEGPANGYTSIPMAMYWAVTTMTTVGFGDITPKTDLGKLIASTMMLLGWGILAVPTGIVTAEMTAQRRSAVRWQGVPMLCRRCGAGGHDTDANFCRVCGERMEG